MTDAFVTASAACLGLAIELRHEESMPSVAINAVSESGCDSHRRDR
jgi:hypothetical protein